jgi:hypothetical protein
MGAMLMSDAIYVYKNAKTLLFKHSDTFKKEASLKKKTRIYRDFLDTLNALAVGAILFKMDPILFAKNLMRTAEAGRSFLTQLQASNQQIPSSYNKPMLSAIGLQQFAMANDIAEISATDQISPEYDDEFLQNQMIVCLLSAVVHKAKIDKRKLTDLCTRTEAYLEGPSAGCDFFRVLSTPEIEYDKLVDFFIAWHDLVSQEYKRKEFLEKTSHMDCVNHHLWLEGLAVLNLCNALGLKINQRLGLIPDLVKNISFDQPQNDAILGVAIPSSKDEL